MISTATQRKRLETLVSNSRESHRRAVKRTERLLRDHAPAALCEKALLQEERTWALHLYAEALLSAQGLRSADSYGASWTDRALADAARHRADVFSYSRALHAL